MRAKLDIEYILAKADIGILASHQEGLPNAILEYMSTGLPIIATEVGGNSELIKHGKNGFLVPPKSPLELSKFIRRLILSPKERIKMGKASREIAINNYSMGKFINSHEKIYQNIII